MKFFTFTKNNIPPLSSLRPAIFDVKRSWFVALGTFVAIFIATTAVGLKLFYYGYFESYKKEIPTEDFQNLININQIKNAVEKRNNLIMKETVLPRDPSSIPDKTAPPAGIEPTSTP